MTTEGSLHDTTDQHVRTDFMQVIHQALLRLMQEHGYSRERATTAILREISNGHSPHDNEVLNVMRRYGIGSKQAARALIVSSTLKQYSRERGLTTVDAVKELTSKLSQAKLVEHGAEPSQDQVASETPMRSQSPEMRIPPVQSMDRPITRNNKITKKSKSSKPKSKEASTKSTNSRKRSMDESSSTPTEQPESPRARSDSVTEAVTAKLADQVDDNTPAKAPSGSPPVRAKRGRDDNTTTSTNKRARSSAA